MLRRVRLPGKLGYAATRIPSTEDTAEVQVSFCTVEVRASDHERRASSSSSTSLRRRRLGVCPDSNAQANRRTVAELLAATDKRSEERRRQTKEQEAAERARENREAAEARALYLDRLAECQEATWKKVASLIETKLAGKYDLAVGLLRDLHVLAERRNEQAAFRSAVEQLREVHAAKRSLIRRISKAGL